MKFWYRLAITLGIPVRELQERISSEEFTYWIAYDRLDPIGNLHQDYNAALVALTTAQVHAKKGKKLKIQDFVLDFEGPKKLTKATDIYNYFRLLSNNGGN